MDSAIMERAELWVQTNRTFSGYWTAILIPYLQIVREYLEIAYRMERPALQYYRRDLIACLVQLSTPSVEFDPMKPLRPRGRMALQDGCGRDDERAYA